MSSMRSKPKQKSGAVYTQALRRPMRRCFALFLLPTLAAFCIGFLWPFARGLYLSFCRFTATGNAAWVGLQNYRRALGDAGFVHALWYTALVALVLLVLINVLAFAVAYALTRRIPAAGIFRGVFFLPNLIGGIVLGYIWQRIFNGLLPTAIVLSTAYGFWGLIVLMCWQQTGYMMIIYIAGLQAIPEEMLEAARVDGAGGWRMLWKIIIPSVMPAVTVCTFLTLTNAFKLFDQNMVLTEGRPYLFQSGTQIKTTEMLALNIYNTFYQSASSRGVGQAKAVLFFVLVASIALLQLRATREKEVPRP